MSALTEKVAREHQLVHIVLAVIICACGEKPATYRDYTDHLVAVTEAAVRAAVAADIRALKHTREQVQEGVRNGAATAYYFGHTAAVVRAARIAEGVES